MENLCLRCGDSFAAKAKSQKYCNKELVSSCPSCQADVLYKCRRQIKKYCNGLCADRGKLVLKLEPIECAGCLNTFTPRNLSAKYCGKRMLVSCKCAKTFMTECLASKRIFCSKSCSAFFNAEVKNSKPIRTFSCELCFKQISTAHGAKKYCSSHEIKCRVCETIFTAKGKDPFVSKICSTICSAIAKWNPTMSLEKIADFKNIDGWALAFCAREGRKPSLQDYAQYFHIRKISPRADRSLFQNSGKPGSLEDPVFDFLKTSFSYEIIRRARIIKNPATGRNLEIDIFLPELALGFEIQDFKTHSPSSDVENLGTSEKRYKNGPTYHELKRELAAQQHGLILIDIWEDEIRTGVFKTILSRQIAEAVDRIAVVP